MVPGNDELAVILATDVSSPSFGKMYSEIFWPVSSKKSLVVVAIGPQKKNQMRNTTSARIM